jgi:hypothetical protein
VKSGQGKYKEGWSKEKNEIQQFVCNQGGNRGDPMFCLQRIRVRPAGRNDEKRQLLLDTDGGEKIIA